MSDATSPATSLAPARVPSETLAGFAALLRDHGLKVGVAEQRDMLQAAVGLGALNGERLSSAWRAIACQSARDWRQWPDLFDRYWRPERTRAQVRVSGQKRPSRDLRQVVQQMQEQMAGQTQSIPGSSTAPNSAANAPSAGDANESDASHKALGGASRTEAMQQRDGQMWLPQELGELQRLARQITAKLRPLPTRRWQASPTGHRLNLRQTLRKSVAWGGEPLQPLWQSRREVPPRLFILVDVSRSMESHAALFLRVARAFATESQARVFVFHTRVAEVTALMQRDSATVQEKINAVTAGFGTGTRIAQSLQTFSHSHARAQLRRGAHVWVMSDGFDTDAPEELAQALTHLRGRGARVSWFHPTHQPPASAAIANARHCIRQFNPLASLSDLRRLASATGKWS
ncbi:VWA domain-containing protein [Hydrogenophaga sp. 5NK40-0174]|uniref:vWA domain-containing protein n=1 Tax=Hydrogenophaga sp. 5NK40-0174 TaxID=3127649 RepID=UPI003102CD64